MVMFASIRHSLKRFFQIGETASINTSAANKIPSDKNGYTTKDLIRLGKQHNRSREYVKALEYFKEAANKGDTIAQFFVGQMYDEGEGVSQDLEKAVYWYKKAAVQGDVSSQCRLAKMYQDGEGVAKDKKQALYWFTKAGEQGCLGAPWHLRKK